MASYSNAQENATTEQYTTGDILYPGSITGNYEQCAGSDCWAGYSGGHIPTWNGYTARWGYGGGILRWTTAINAALEQSGFQVDGYNYSWVVKNFDAESNQNDGYDYMRISVSLYDTSGNYVYYKQFNLDGDYPVTTFTGTEYFDESFAAEDLSNVQIRAEGDDNGFWAGHYGPEFFTSESSFNLIYSPLQQENNPCDTIPVTDPTCPNYVTPGIIEQPTTVTIQDATFDDSTGDVVLDPIAEATNDSVSEELDAGLGDMVAESSQSNDQKQAQEESGGGSGSGGGGLSDAQKNALAAAAAEANAAEQVAAESSATSIAIGDAANESAVSATLQNSAAMSSASQSMSSGSGSQQGSSGSQSGSNDGSSTDPSSMGLPQIAGGNDYSGGPELALEITITEDVAVNELSDIVESILKETFNRIQQQSQESQNAGIIDKPSDDPAQDQKLALMQNPDIVQYQQLQLQDSTGYPDKEIYGGQRVVDNPAGRFFNGASDQLHKEMVRQQYAR